MTAQWTGRLCTAETQRAETLRVRARHSMWPPEPQTETHSECTALICTHRRFPLRSHLGRKHMCTRRGCKARGVSLEAGNEVFKRMWCKCEEERCPPNVGSAGATVDGPGLAVFRHSARIGTAIEEDVTVGLLVSRRSTASAKPGRCNAFGNGTAMLRLSCLSALVSVV